MLWASSDPIERGGKNSGQHRIILMRMNGAEKVACGQSILVN